MSLSLQIIAPNTTIEYDFNKQMSLDLVGIVSFCITAYGLIKIYSTFRIFWVVTAKMIKFVVSIKRKAMLLYEFTTDLLVYKKMHKKISSASISVLFHRSSRFRMAGSGLGRSLSLLDVAELHGETDRSSSLLPSTTASSSLLDVRERTRVMRRFDTHTSTRLATPRTATSSGSASVEEGLALLGDGTICIEQLEHAELSVDNSILDYESDCLDLDPPTPQAADKLPLSTAMETDVERAAAAPQEFDAMYHQCKSARLACRTDIFVSVSQDNSFGRVVSVQSPQFGSFEDHCNFKDTYHGSRVLRGSSVVNESISCSFDPANLMCISCNNEHGLVGKDPLIVMFSDQNFVSKLECAKEKCINVVRVENATLLDLFEIAKEIFSNVTLPEGSIFMFGSASYLGRSGTSLYARGWTEVVALASDTWRGIRICPLIPLILSECPGTIVRELSELATWLDRVYQTNPQGLREPWQCLVKAMEACSVGSTTLENMDNYKIVLPGSLLTRNLDTTITFCSTNSRPMTCKGLSKDIYSELLGSLLTCIFEKFRACSRPEAYFERAAEKKVTSEALLQKVTLVGASNLRHCVPHVAGQGVQVIDHTLPGWTPSPGNVAKLQEDIETDMFSSYVFDLYGNSSLRFEQYDGTTALPFQSNGRFHFGGKVVTTPPEIFRKIVENTIPIIRTKGDSPGVIIPPLPRGLFSRCCSDSSHCINANDESYAMTLLTGFIGLRNDLIKYLVHAGLTNFQPEC